jgi:hypothetical protein
MQFKNPTPYTIASIQAAKSVDPEFIEVPTMKPMFAIGKTRSFELIRNGHIRSVNLRKEGNVKGRRLIEVASVRRYLNSLMEGAGI